MATNLRLGAEAEAAVRAEAERTGQSQQELIRAAVDRYLGLDQTAVAGNDNDALVSTGTVRPSRTSFLEVDDLILLRDTTTEELLDRAERF